MKLNEFIEKLELAYNLPSRYESGGWGKWNGATWGWDCVCLIKGILWGWSADTSKPRGGGAVYCSNGVPDIGTEQMINVCNNVSTDFSNIQIGEILWLQGHVGVYIGDGNVIEATAGWNTYKVIKSQIDSSGNRTYNGQGGSARWQKHGFLPYVDYSATPTPTNYFEPRKSYKLLYAKYLRTTPAIANNIVKYKTLDAYSKTICNNVRGNAQLKKDVVIEPLHIVEETNGRIWASYGNCWWVCQNKDGEKQAIRLD